jgi:polar amino acid transport system substrate-binding protein
LGMRPEFQIMNYDSLIAALETKKVDIVLACLNETPERAKKISFSTPYNISYSTLMVRKDDWEGPTAEGTSSAGTNVSKGFMAELQESFQRNFVMEDRYKIVLSGLKTTIVITVWSAILGTIMGFGVCLLRRAKIKVISRLLDLFVSIMAGMPLVVFLMIMYYIVFGKVTIDPVYVAILAFAISMAASTSDMMSAGIDAVDKGQLEAAYAMGFSKMQTFIKIVTPQALKHIMPTFTGEFVSMFKMTSIVGYIAIQDLTKMSDIIRSRTYEAFFPLIVTALIYFVAAWSMAGILVYAQYKLDPKKRQRTLKGIKL